MLSAAPSGQEGGLVSATTSFVLGWISVEDSSTAQPAKTSAATNEITRTIVIHIAINQVITGSLSLMTSLAWV